MRALSGMIFRCRPVDVHASPVMNGTLGECFGQTLVDKPSEGSLKEMTQNSVSDVSPIHCDGILPAGTKAPNFTLHVTPDQTLSLSDLLGHPVILAFYPADLHSNNPGTTSFLDIAAFFITDPADRTNGG
jgi:hypothetical protein